MTTTLPHTAPRRADDPDPEPVTRRPRRSWRARLNRWDTKASPYAYVAPFFLLFGLIGLFPLGYTFFVSLFHWKLLKGQGDFAGLSNYAGVLTDGFFWNSLLNTFSIFVLSAVPQLIAAVVIAAVLDQNIRAKTFWRMSILLPYVVTPAAVALIFSNLFGEQYGLINTLLQHLGMDPIAWKSDTLPSHLAIATMVNWRWTGYNALILLAAMQAVPRDIHEAAALDGAGPVRRFFSMTLPSIRPTMIFVIITATVGGLQIFVEPRLFDATHPGGQQRQYQTTVLYLWEMAFQRQDFGKASAIAWVLFLIIVAVGVVNFLLSKTIASAETKAAVRRGRRRRAGRGVAAVPDAASSGTAGALTRVPQDEAPDPATGSTDRTGGPR